MTYKILFSFVLLPLAMRVFLPHMLRCLCASALCCRVRSNCQIRLFDVVSLRGARILYEACVGQATESVSLTYAVTL